MSKASNIQVCPWCPVVGTSNFMDSHMETHEVEFAPGALAAELTLAKAEIKRLKAQLKERQKDYAKTLGEMAKAIKFLHDDIESCVQHMMKEKEEC